MITDTILQVIANMLVGLFSLLPNMPTANGTISEAIEWFLGFFAGIVYAIPSAGNLLLVMVAFIVFFGGIFIWNSIKFIANIIRGSGA